MDTLPKEILEHTLRYIQNSRLMMLRLVNKKWKNLIEHKIFLKDKFLSMDECIITSNYYHLLQCKDLIYEYRKSLILITKDRILINRFKIFNHWKMSSQYYWDYRKNLPKQYNINELLAIYSESNHLSVVKFLLTKGANIHDAENRALRWSAENGHTNIVKLLLEKGANVHACYDYALHASVVNEHINVVKLLLDNNADIHSDDDFVFKNSKGDMLEFLLQHTKKID
jgi:hypothetical protein